MPLPVTRTVVTSAIPLISGTIKKFIPRMGAATKNPIFTAVAFGEIVDAVQSLLGSDGSDLSPEEIEGVNDVAKIVGHILNDEGILWPTDREGEPIPPRYLTINLDQGRAWFHRDYFSRKSIRSARRRGWGRGRNSRRTRVRGEVSV